MDLSQKLYILADAAKYDASCASSGSKKTRSGKGMGSTEGMGICHSYTPDGRCVSLLKILFTNYCIFDCKYCINRISSSVPRAQFTAKEVIDLTLDFYRRNYIEGLFLSSGIIRDSNYTMEQMIAIAKALRIEHNFKGYIHLKTIPNADKDLIYSAGLYADRLSINIELPTSEDLKQLAPEKNHLALEKNMSDIHLKSIEIKEDKSKGFKAPLFVPAGQSTQMIIGATPTSDRIILDNAEKLYKKYFLRRVYYSAYSPIPHADARLPSVIPPLVREHRLYQADWLIRFYGFNVNEIAPNDTPNLDLSVDPKISWALRNLKIFPVDINKAPRSLLLRVPGIGVNSANKIISIRRYRRLKFADLIQLKIALNKVKYFIVTANYKPSNFSYNSLSVKSFTLDKPQLTLDV